MAEQLVKKEGLGYSRVYPKTFIDAIKDRQTGQSLEDILANFNCYFISYSGDAESTRLQIPLSMRRPGLWITYVTYDNIVEIEYYQSDDVNDEAWKEDTNWMKYLNKDNILGILDGILCWYEA